MQANRGAQAHECVCVCGHICVFQLDSSKTKPAASQAYIIKLAFIYLIKHLDAARLLSSDCTRLTYIHTCIQATTCWLVSKRLRK